MDLDDSLRLSQSELEQGIATITQSQPFFDCFPAISCAYEYTRNFANKMREVEEDFENYWQEEPEEDSLKYEDFWMFISVLKQYYKFCQVVRLPKCRIDTNYLSLFQLLKNDEVLEDFPVTKVDLECPKILKEIEGFAGSVNMKEMFQIPNEEDEDGEERIEVEEIWFSRFVDVLYKINLLAEVEKKKKILELEKEL